MLAAAFGLSACVSDAVPREGNREAGSGNRADAGGKDGAASDAPRGDAADTWIVDDTDDASDDGDNSDAPGRDDVSDAAPGIDVTDSALVLDARDSATGADGNEVGPAIDANDSAAPVDAADSGSSGDGGDAFSDSDAGDAGGRGDASDACAGGDTSGDAADGGVIVFYDENFDSGLGTFSAAVTVCGANPPLWSNNAGYAHASEPQGIGVSRISSPAVAVPPNTSNVVLRMSHRFNTENGYDCGQLLVAVNGGADTQVTVFTTGPYTNGGHTDPATCALVAGQNQFPGWSGNHAEWVSEVNLSAAPFNVVAGNTVTITFRMTIDDTQTGTGWDINWVTLSANSP
jgi:hypothetical protein